MKKYIQVIIIISIFSVLFCTALSSEAKDFFGITDYKPSKFQEKATAPFFFRIGRQLKFGDSISEDAPTIFQASRFSGKMEVYPSPDGNKAVVASDGNLYLVEIGKESRLILKKAYNPKFNGKIEKNYMHYSTQWNMHSTSFYIPMMSLVDSVPRRKVFKIDVGQQFDLTEVLPDIISQFFLMGENNICYDFAPGNGDVIWYCQSNGVSKKIDSLTQNYGIRLEGGSVLTDKLFVSYEGNDHETEIWLTWHGFYLKRISGKTIGFYSRKYGEEPIFKSQGGVNIKGHFVDGISHREGIVLPGGRYAVITVYHDNFTGQLLIDGETGKYRELPEDTRVYLHLNSWEYKKPVFEIFGYARLEFRPYGKLKNY